MLAELVGNHPEPIVQGAIASYYSLADVLDLLVKNRLEQDISPVTLQTAITSTFSYGSVFMGQNICHQKATSSIIYLLCWKRIQC